MAEPRLSAQGDPVSMVLVPRPQEPRCTWDEWPASACAAPDAHAVAAVTCPPALRALGAV